MQMTGVARLGRDAELKHIVNGTVVVNLNMAFNYGQKDGNGNKPTQWIEASLWGKLAEALVGYLRKGQQVWVTLEDPHIETYQGKNGEGHKLSARVLTIELVGGRSDNQQPSQHQQQKQDGYAPPPKPAAKAADDMDDDIPF